MYHVKKQDGKEEFVNQVHYIKVSPTSGCYIEAIEDEAQGVVINGAPYSINTANPIEGIEAITLTKQEDWTEEMMASYNEMVLNQAKTYKLLELSEACNAAIENGAEVELSDGAKESFTYTLADQANVSEMFTAVMSGATEYPYHQNGGDCKMYSAQDIIKIYSTLSGMKTGQITYQNQLKQYVKTMTNVDDVYEVSYGQELTGEYLEKYNTLIAQAQEQMQTVLSKMMG